MNPILNDGVKVSHRYTRDGYSHTVYEDGTVVSSTEITEARAAVLGDYVARAFKRYLEERYPGVKWVRVYDYDG